MAVYLSTVLILSLIFVVQGFVDDVCAPIVLGSMVPGAYDTRIIGGEDAPEGRAPYQVSLRAGNRHFCGGCILNKRWVLSVAHCTIQLYGLQNIQVVVGTVKLSTGGEYYPVAHTIEHEDYDRPTINNDISLVKVTKNIKFHSLVQPIRLPRFDTPGGVKLFLTGWGSTSYPLRQPDHLQMLNVTSLDIEICKEELAHVNPPVLDSQICSQPTVGQGACHGDSGGPLADGNTVVGLVSWGMPCAIGAPDVYTRVYSFLDWIVPKINNFK